MGFKSGAASQWSKERPLVTVFVLCHSIHWEQQPNKSGSPAVYHGSSTTAEDTVLSVPKVLPTSSSLGGLYGQ